VQLRDHKRKGKITPEYSSPEDFDRALVVLTGQKGIRPVFGLLRWGEM
jgi:hypothetical protein